MLHQRIEKLEQLVLGGPFTDEIQYIKRTEFGNNTYTLRNVIEVIFIQYKLDYKCIRGVPTKQPTKTYGNTTYMVNKKLLRFEIFKHSDNFIVILTIDGVALLLNDNFDLTLFVNSAFVETQTNIGTMQNIENLFKSYVKQNDQQATFTTPKFNGPNGEMDIQYNNHYLKFRFFKPQEMRGETRYKYYLIEHGDFLYSIYGNHDLETVVWWLTQGIVPGPKHYRLD